MTPGIEGALGAPAPARPALRWRLPVLTAGLLLGVGLLHGTALFLLHPDLTGRQLMGLIALTVVAAAVGGALASWLVGVQLHPLSRLQQAFAALAAGELPPPLELPPSDGGVAELARHLDQFGARQRRLLEGVRASATRLADEASGLLATVTRQGLAAANRAEALRRATATSATLGDVTGDAAREAGAVIELSQRAEVLFDEGLGALEQAVRSAGALGDQVRRIAASMSDLSERTQQVGEIVATVKDLAEQSDLLALNASIEAAKAGDQGRGFAAVAMEMRNLAEQSRQAAAQVRSVLGEVQKHAREAVLATEEGSSRAELATGRVRSAGSAVAALAQVTRGSAASSLAIADRSRQQAAGVAGLVEAVAALTAATRRGPEDAATLEAHAAEIARLARVLSELP